MIGHLGRLLEDEHPNHPQALLERTRTPGRSMGSLARGLETFFTEHGVALANDHANLRGSAYYQQLLLEA